MWLQTESKDEVSMVGWLVGWLCCEKMEVGIEVC